MHKKFIINGFIHIPLIDFLEVLCALLHEIFLQFFQPGEQPCVVRFQLDRLFPDILSCFATYAVHYFHNWEMASHHLNLWLILAKEEDLLYRNIDSGLESNECIFEKLSPELFLNNVGGQLQNVQVPLSLI